MELTVDGDAGELTLRDLSPSCSIRDVHEELQRRSGVPVKQQLLTFSGAVLGPSKTLGELDCSPLHLTSFAQLVKLSPLRLPATEQRGIQLSQLEALIRFLAERSCPSGLVPWRDRWGSRIFLKDLNLYHLADWVICPSTAEDKCSYVELIASDAEAQKPHWFVSHAWQEPVQDFLTCLRGHATVRQLEEEVAYWVCAYANNQHELGNDLRFNPRETSFFRAMQLCGGVLLVLDPLATPFARVWCCFELAMALTDLVTPQGRFLLDIATVSQGAAELLTDGMVPSELKNEHCVCAGAGGKAKAKREETFPIELIQRALEIDIVAASASREVDKLRILNSIGGLPEEELDTNLPEPLPEERKESYERVNRSLRSIFALASLSQVVSKDLKRLMPAICQALQEDSSRRSVHLSFANSLKFKDPDLLCIARALPPNLTDLLRLDLRSCHGLSDASVLELAGAIGRLGRLRALFLDFYMCVRLTDASVHEIFTAMQGMEEMRELDINLRGLIKVSCSVLAPLTAALRRMPSLRKLHLNLMQTRQSAKAAEQLTQTLEQLAHLQILKLYFTDCPLVDDAAANSLGKSLSGKALRESILCFSGTAITDAGMAGLCQGLRRLGEMQRATLRFRGCHGLTVASLQELGEAMSALPLLQKLVVETGKCRQLPRSHARRYAGTCEKVLASPAFQRGAPDVLDQASDPSCSPSSCASQPLDAKAETVVRLFQETGALDPENLYAVLRALEPTLSQESYEQLEQAAESKDAEQLLRWLLDVQA